MSVLRTPLGLAATVLTRRPCWCSPSSRRSSGPTTRTRSTPSNILAGPSAEHWAGTDNLGRDIFSRTLVATRLSVELALAATAIAVVVGLLLGTASYPARPPVGRLVSAGVNIAVAFPGMLLALFFAVDLRRRRDRRGARDRPRRRAGVRPPRADPGRRRRLPRLRLRGPGRRRRPGADPAAARAAQHRRAAGRQRHHRRRRRAARPSPACRSWASASSSPRTTGAGCSSTASARSTSTRPRRSRPALAVLVAGLAFNLFGESVAKALGVGVVGGIPLRCRRGTRRSSSDDAGSPVDDDRRGTEATDLVLDVRDLG